MADAFAELMAAEAAVRSDMRKKLEATKKGATDPLQQLNRPAAKQTKPRSGVASSTEQQLRALGLGASPAVAMAPGLIVTPKPMPPQRTAAPEPTAVAPESELPAAALVEPRLAPSQPADAPADALTTILSARKEQLKKARGSALIGLRAPGDNRDSDDDDDDDDEGDGASANSKPAGAASATFARELNRLSDPSAKARQAALTALSSTRLSTDEMRDLVRPLLLRFADSAERCRELAVELLAKWANGAEPSELAVSSGPFERPSSPQPSRKGLLPCT